MDEPKPIQFISTSTSPKSTPHSTQESVNTSFAFLVHSQDTIPNNLPPSVDNKPLARQRRRRTSPEDQAILEAEFQHNSKPDKKARQRIVGRVALGEKEVQIWFQNRRQSKRRKSLPPLHYNVLPTLHPNRASDVSTMESEAATSSQELSKVATVANDAGYASFTASSTQSSDPSPSDYISTPPASQRNVQDNVPPEQASTEITPASSGNNAILEDCQTPSQDEAASAANQRKSGDLRLSLTSSGAAKVIYGTEPTPSPPRSQPLAPTPFATRQTLRRSYSAVALGSPTRSLDNKARRFQAPRIHRVPSGRSRDSRAWEFWCDSDARNGLVHKADVERNGSAVDAISLIRSQSSFTRRMGALTPNANKGNIKKRSTNSKTARDKQKGRNTGESLTREMSSIGRLHSKRDPSTSNLDLYEDPASPSDCGKDKPGKLYTKASETSSGDSDKENKDPENFGNAGERSRTQPTSSNVRQRPVLGESHTATGLGLGLKAATNNSHGNRSAYGSGRSRRRVSEGVDDQENFDQEEDVEIAKFMGSFGRRSQAHYSSHNRSTGGEGEAAERDDDADAMDCVQGLLSLSQGAWR